MNLRAPDAKLAQLFDRLFVPFARIAIFFIYFWFGLLKLLGLSPAAGLVRQLFDQSIHFMQFDPFYALFASFEMLIGILFLVPRLTRLAVALFFLHMITAFLPLIFLPGATWQAFLVPTLEGQYIIKNLALIACVIGIARYELNRQTKVASKNPPS